jgi:UDP-N-acetylmuramoyl-L-alanyl-D-glutamate--2,6-diaminopimelate ligase
LGKDYTITETSLKGMTVELRDGRKIISQLPGTYNAENLLGAFLAIETLESKFNQPVLDLKLNITGRMERVGLDSEPRFVFVDYAHTPDALEKALRLLKQLKDANAKLSVVFGCGGDRDPTKRPQMGAVASQIADRVILTSDNPRSEDPIKIIEDIRKGCGQRTLEVEVDRRDAIKLAISQMASGDVLLIAGKGHESIQIIKDKQLPFSDSTVAHEFIKSLSIA